MGWFQNFWVSWFFEDATRVVSFTFLSPAGAGMSSDRHG